jgi:hypothetical protein
MTKKITVEWTNFDNIPCAKSFESEELARIHKVHLEIIGIQRDSIYISEINRD